MELPPISPPPPHAQGPEVGPSFAITQRKRASRAPKWSQWGCKTMQEVVQGQICRGPAGAPPPTPHSFLQMAGLDGGRGLCIPPAEPAQVPTQPTGVGWVHPCETHTAGEARRGKGEGQDQGGLQSKLIQFNPKGKNGQKMTLLREIELISRKKQYTASVD